MDGLSGGASIIAVISRAVQLGEAACKLAQFFATVEDAPNEIVRLRGMLSLVQAASMGAKTAIECQRRSHNDDIPGVEHIHNALSVCRAEVFMIETFLDRIGDVQSGTNRASRVVARLRLATKKDDIREHERQLGHTLGVLNVLLTANLMYTLDLPWPFLSLTNVGTVTRRILFLFSTESTG